MSTALRCVLFDLDDVLVDYDRSVRVQHLATAIGRSPAAVHEAIYDYGIEDAGDRGALDARAYLAALSTWLGGEVSKAAWIAARRAATQPRPELLAPAEAASERATLGLLTHNGVLMTGHLPQIVPALFLLFARRAFASAQFGARKPTPTVTPPAYAAH